MVFEHDRGRHGYRWMLLPQQGSYKWKSTSWQSRILHSSPDRLNRDADLALALYLTFFFLAINFKQEITSNMNPLGAPIGEHPTGEHGAGTGLSGSVSDDCTP